MDNCCGPRFSCECLGPLNDQPLPAKNMSNRYCSERLFTPNYHFNLGLNQLWLTLFLSFHGGSALQELVLCKRRHVREQCGESAAIFMRDHLPRITNPVLEQHCSAYTYGPGTCDEVLYRQRYDQSNHFNKAPLSHNDQPVSKVDGKSVDQGTRGHNGNMDSSASIAAHQSAACMAMLVLSAVLCLDKGQWSDWVAPQEYCFVLVITWAWSTR